MSCRLTLLQLVVAVCLLTSLLAAQVYEAALLQHQTLPPAGRIVAGDIEGDGDDDLVQIASGQALFWIIWNTRPGPMLLGPMLPLPHVPRDVAIGDIDQDGDSDFAFANDSPFFSTVTVVRNLGTGLQSTDWTLPQPSSSFDLIDVDGDGDLDLSSEGASWLFNDGTGAFPNGLVLPNALTLANNLSSTHLTHDLDGDGDADLVLVGTGGLPTIRYFQVLRNDGAGVFVPTTVFGTAQHAAFPTPIDFYVSAPVAGDFTGDGIVDIACFCSTLSGSRVVLFVGAPGLVFTQGPTVPYLNTTTGLPAYVRDLDGNGRPDLVFAARAANLPRLNLLHFYDAGPGQVLSSTFPATILLFHNFAVFDIDGFNGPDILQSGSPTISDFAGSTHRLWIHRDAEVAMDQASTFLSIVSGDDQVAGVNESLAQQLIVRTRDALSQPLSGVNLTFTGVGVSTFPGSATTGSDGQSSTNATVGSNAGELSVTAQSAVSNAVVFEIHAVDPPYLGSHAAGTTPASGGSTADVLLGNGSSGGFARRIDIAVGAPITLTLAEAPLGAPLQAFVLWGRSGVPSPGEATTLPNGLGTLCFPPFDLLPQDPPYFRLATTYDPTAAASLAPGSLLPWSASLPGGLPFPFELTFQGVIVDGAANVTLTNGLILKIE